MWPVLRSCRVRLAEVRDEIKAVIDEETALRKEAAPQFAAVQQAEVSQGTGPVQ